MSFSVCDKELFIRNNGFESTFQWVEAAFR